MQTVETASPQQYLRLLLTRLLETQKCLSSKINEPGLAFMKEQFLVNGYTLSEVKSWLEAVGDNSPLGPLPVSVQPVANYGHAEPESADGLPITPIATTARPSTEPLFPAPSSSRPRVILPDSAQISNGSVTFQLD